MMEDLTIRDSIMWTLTLILSDPQKWGSRLPFFLYHFHIFNNNIISIIPQVQNHFLVIIKLSNTTTKFSQLITGQRVWKRHLESHQNNWSSFAFNVFFIKDLMWFSINPIFKNKKEDKIYYLEPIANVDKNLLLKSK